MNKKSLTCRDIIELKSAIIEFCHISAAIMKWKQRDTHFHFSQMLKNPVF